MKKNILYITKHFPPMIGGGTRRIEAIYDILIKQSKLKLTVATELKEKRKYSDNILYIKQLFFQDCEFSNNGVSFVSKKYKIKLFNKAFIGWLPNVLKNILTKKFDILYCTTPMFINVVIGYIYKIFHQKSTFIIEYRDFYSFDPEAKECITKKILQYFEILILKRANFVITTTKSMKNILSEHILNDKIFIIRNYISKKDYNEAINLPNIVFDKINYHVGYVGKLNTGRNPNTIISLLKNKIENKNIMIHFVGTNKEEEEAIIEIAQKEDIDIKQIIFHGIVDRMISLQFMKSFDAVYLSINANAEIKKGYGIPGKLYDYIALNNNIIADINSFNNLMSEFDLITKQKMNNHNLFYFHNNYFLDGGINSFLKTIIK